MVQTMFRLVPEAPVKVAPRVPVQFQVVVEIPKVPHFWKNVVPVRFWGGSGWLRVLLRVPRWKFRCRSVLDLVPVRHK